MQPTQTPPQIHPTALVSSETELASGVVIGAFAILDGKVCLGEGCIIHPGAQMIGPITMGQGNHVYSNTAIGERPQHLLYRDEPTGVRIGNGNTFRENVTVHRGTTASGETRIGDSNYFMVGSHVGHDCQVGNGCILVNNALLGGHCILDDGAYVSGNAAVHQFCRMGRLSFLGAGSITTKDIPPFIMQQGINSVVAVNVIGMRRAGLNREQIDAARRVYRIVFRQRKPLPDALAEVQRELGAVDVVREFMAFVRHSQRGINHSRGEHTGQRT